MLKNVNSEILHQLKELEKLQETAFAVYHKEAYAIQIKMKELRDKMKENNGN